MMTEELKAQLHAQYNPEGSVLRNFQMGLFEIMRLFDEFATKHDIKYSLAFGTLLGAVRHNGFIPWDDDADIVISREEWEKLRRLIGQDGTLEGKLKIKEIVRPVLTIEGVGIIDIFILDYCPQNVVKRQWKLGVARFVSLLLKCKERLVNRNFKRKKPWFVLFPIAACFSMKKLQKMQDKVAQWYAQEKPSKGGMGCIYNSSISEMPDQFPLDPLRTEMIRLNFEGHEFSCVADYDTCLKITYGDYMSLPKHRSNLGRVTDDTFCEIKDYKIGCK